MKTVKIHDVTVMAKFDKAFGADRPIAYASQTTANKAIERLATQGISAEIYRTPPSKYASAPNRWMYVKVN
jgi:hypothetical protein